MVAFFDTGTQSVTGIAYATSTDNGATWSAATQVDSTQTGDFSVAIDGSDNIYLAFDIPIASSSGGIFVRKLTYSAGTWTIGASNQVLANACCTSHVTLTKPSVAVNAASVVYVAMLDTYNININTNGTSADVYTSSNLTTWTTITAPYDCNVGALGNCTTPAAVGPAIVSDGNAEWLLDGAMMFVDISGTNSWAEVPGDSTAFTAAGSLSYGLDTLYLLYPTSSGITFQNYNITTGSFSSTTVLSASTSDVIGEISTDSQNVWAIFQSFVGSSSYNISYKRFDGSTWDNNPTNLTTDNLNNVDISSPARLPNTANVPVIWQTGTASPYTVKSAVFSNIGTVTDTGNQTGSLTGSLTGSSGDMIVKCGIWYYNTINIVNGMTIKVCASNGQTGGTLELHANSVTIAGSVDGAGRGMPGGVSVIAPGGAGGSGALANSSPGVAGQTGVTPLAGGNGSGSYGGSGGSSGTSSTSGGTAGSAGAVGTGGGGGGGGGGSATVAGGAGTTGGYLISGGNGDSSIDTSVSSGSGGGSGGSGGSGAGGGSGGSGSQGLSLVAGSGANGGIGGKGGNGGAAVKVIATTISVTGTINLKGQTSGASGSGSVGQGGDQGCNIGTAPVNC